MAWSFDRETFTGTAGTAALTRTYTMTAASGVPVGAVLVVSGGDVTNIPTGMTSTLANAGALSSFVQIIAGDGGSGTEAGFAYAAAVLGTLTNTDTVSITFSVATAPSLVGRTFTSSQGKATAVALDKTQITQQGGVAAAGAWTSPTTATSTSTDPLQIGVVTFDNGAGTGAVTTAAGWNSTTTVTQGPTGSMFFATRWKSPGTNTGAAFSGTNSSPAAEDILSAIGVINATIAPSGGVPLAFNPIPFMGGH